MNRLKLIKAFITAAVIAVIALIFISGLLKTIQQKCPSIKIKP